ncbi:nucleotidyltransferase domain-containing protein [Cyanothece sp. BG0011]|uniref:type VII toxin-antitoxin system MntA family adenylyltransferase antitoxin n=1 Tax=Cyanothece sp. BG0011 TaxID=2082950 RepID=UPI000D1D85B4|nr:nucleotidyltransferase domain-containing protein [Cyanothece sp. BG0011]
MLDLNLPQLQQIQNQLKQTVPYVKMLILFGSRARKDSHSYSDWDFAALYDETIKQQGKLDYLEIYNILADIFNIPSDKIDLVSLDICSPLIAHYIARDGQLLYEQKSGLFEDFKQQALMNSEQLENIRKSLRQNLEHFLEARGV